MPAANSQVPPPGLCATAQTHWAAHIDAAAFGGKLALCIAGLGAALLCNSQAQLGVLNERAFELHRHVSCCGSFLCACRACRCRLHHPY